MADCCIAVRRTPCLAATSDDIRQDALVTAERCAAEITDRFAKTWANYAIAEEWSHTDPERAAELADQLPSWTAKRDLLSVVMVAWGQADPKAAGEWGLRFKQRTQGTLDQRNTALRYAVLGMVAKDPKLADQLIWKHLKRNSGEERPGPRRWRLPASWPNPIRWPRWRWPRRSRLMSRFALHALRGILREWASKDPAAAARGLGRAQGGRLPEGFPPRSCRGLGHPRRKGRGCLCEDDRGPLYEDHGAGAWLPARWRRPIPRGLRNCVRSLRP